MRYTPDGSDRVELHPCFFGIFYFFGNMKLHLNLSLRRALMAAMAAVCTLSSTSFAGVVDTRYDLQYYMDFARNKGMFGAGVTNIEVYYKDGIAVSNPVIPLMPNLDSYGQKMAEANLKYGTLMGFGGCGLVNPQFVVGAAHVGNHPVLFLTEDGDMSTLYASAGYKSYATDVDVQRLNKIVTEVAYTPMADDAFMRTLSNGDWLWRLGDGHQYNSAGEIVSSFTGSNTLGGIIGIDSVSQSSGGDWAIKAVYRENDTASDLRTPLDIGFMFGDSGSPMFAWDAENERFLYVVACSSGTTNAGFDNMAVLRSNPGAVQEGMASYSVTADCFSGTDTILWGNQNAETGKGMLSQGESVLEYTGKGTGNTLTDTLGLTFTTSDAENELTLELQSSVDMGAGAMSFDSGRWKLTEIDADSTFKSAGFVVNKGAELTLELTATADEEWRKVGEGTMTIAGSGNNEAVLRVGGGSTQYNVSYDDSGNIVGCTLGNIGETRLNRADGYAAGSIRLEGGVAILVLMQDGQFKTDSLAGDTFTFGSSGGLLNLNGHDLSWGVINQDDSGVGARIGNFTPLGENSPGLSTFTYTGTGIFAGCFMDAGSANAAQLAVVYNNAAENAMWTLTGNHSNGGGFTVEAGTMVLQGSNTPHVRLSDSGDWTYASLEGSDVTVKSGATFQLSHHTLMTGGVCVDEGGSFIINQTVNERTESIAGSLRQDMEKLGIIAMKGNVVLNGAATMIVDTESSVVTRMQGNITNDVSDTASASFTKTGMGIFEVDGKVQVAQGTVQEGGLVVGTAEGFSAWTIQEKGFLAVAELDNSTLLSYIDTSSSGILALSHNQEKQLDLSDHQNLIIGAWGDVSYGTAGAVLSTVTDATYGEVWRLGGGTGMLTVNFQLTGEASLLIGNEWSSGTVHLANTANDFRGDIYILGTGNRLSYVDGALGAALVNLTYGNALALNDVAQLGVIKEGASGVLALATDDDLDLSGTTLSLGANESFTYSGTLTVDSNYRFGGSGQLTLDTVLDGAAVMEIDGQGTTGSSVTFARENAYSGSIIAGGGLELSEANSSGDIGIHVGHEAALAAAESVQLQKGAVLYTDGNSLTVNNLSMESGSALRNNGSRDSLVLLNVTAGTDTSLADGVLNSYEDSAALHLVKSGQGSLFMAANENWSGGLTIAEGTVKATISSSGDFTSDGGIGSADNAIHVADSGTLSLNGVAKQGFKLGGTVLPQTVSGTGTIEFSTGGAALFSVQETSFEGTISLKGNTRLYVGTHLTTDNYYNFSNNKNAVNNATIDIEAGSQVRIGSGLRYLKATRVNLDTDFVISGTGFSGSDWGLVHSECNLGALSIDGDSTVYGNISLKDDACIASWSAGKLLSSVSAWQSCVPGSDSASYALKGYLGGTVRGKILGEGKTLTIAGNESMTFTADSANTYGDLVIANGNGNNDDKFALLLNGGTAVSQISTALGAGKVTLNDGLILRFAGTGVANNTDVVYTYANNIAAGSGASLQSYNITNKLTGTVSMDGESLNMATADGGVLELAGGISGSGTLNVGASSVIILGSAAETLSRSTTPQFSGSVVAESGADITLASPTIVSTSTIFSGTDSLTLRFGGIDDYTLGGISMTASSDEVTSTLSLNFDFSNTPVAGDESTWTTLFSDISAGKTIIELSLNMFNDIEEGTYTLATGTFSGSFELADTLNNRLELVQRDGSLILAVDADSRLYWSAAAATLSWNTSDLNWYQQASAAENVAFTTGANVVLDASGAVNTSSVSRETVTLAEAQTVGTLAVKDDGAYYELFGEATLTGDKLVVGEQGDLKLSTSSASFTSGVQVDNASLEVSGTALTANVSATNGGFFAMNNGASLVGNIEVNGGATAIADASVTGKISTQGSGSASLDMLTLTGEITTEEGGRIIAASAYDGTTATYAAAKLSGSLNWGGESGHCLSLLSGSLYLDNKVKISALSVGAGLTATVWNNTAAAGADKILDAVSLGNNAILQTNDRDKVSAATSIGNLSLSDSSATLRDQYHSGYYAIDSLSLGVGVSTATLNIVKKADSTLATVVNLGSEEATAGNFKGTIVLDSDTGDGGDTDRSLFLVLGGERAAAGAQINMSSSDSNTAVLGLGVNTDNAVIAGLDSASGLGKRAKVFSGSVGTQVQWGSSSTAPSTVGDALRSLTIDTASGSSHAFYGEIMSNLNLVKSGDGTQQLLGASTDFNGSLSVEDGVLVLGSEATLGSLSGLSVSDGATLDLCGIDFNSRTSLSLAAGATSSVSSGALFAFGDIKSGVLYRIFDLSSGTSLEGWDSNNLSTANFSINGESMLDMGRVYVTLDSAIGSFTYYQENYDLVWNGGEEGIWNREESNTSWLQSLGGTTSELSTYFANNDNVIFDSSASVKIAEAVKVGSVTIADNTTVTLTETGALTAESITVGKDAMLTFATEKTGYTAANISGEGKVVLDLTDNWNNALKLGSSFTGETYVTSGYIDLTNAAVGKTLRLANGVNANSATGVTTVTADIILEGTSIVHANKEKAITYVGTVTGENGVFESNGGSSHTFNAEVNLAGFKTSHSGNTNTFNAKTTLATATISQAAVNFNGETALGTAAISGGTTTFNASADVTAATFSGGTTNFNGSTALTTANFSGGTVNFATDSLEIGTFNRGSGNINFKLADGATKTNYTIGNISGDNYGNLTVDSGVTLNAGTITTPVAFAGSSRNLTVNGEMNLSGGMNMRYSKDVVLNGTGTLNVAEGVNLQLTQWGAANISVNKLNIGGNLSLNSYWQANSVHHVNILSGETTVEGQVQHASTGYNNGSDRVTLNINGGSLIMKGGATMSQGTTTLSAGKLEQAGGTSTISNTFSMSGGELAVSGGTMTIESTPTVTGGDVAISGGTLSFGTAEAASALLAGADNINLSGGELDLSVGNFTESSGGLSLGAVMAVSGSGTIKLGDSLTTDTTYDIFTIGDGASLDWENMGDHLMVNGTAVSRYSGASLAVTDAGVATLSFSGLDKSSVYWVGGESGAWNYSSSSWDLGAADADASNNVSFLINDTVVFASDASVTVADGVTVGGLTIEAGKHLTTTGGIEMADSAVITTGDGSKWTLADGTEQTLSKSQVSDVTALEIAKGATLTVSDSAMAGYSATNLSGEGTVELNLSATYGNTVNVGSSFKGETYVTGGWFTVTSAVVGETLRLAHGVNMQSDKPATVAANLILEGETIVHANSSKPITYSGSVTGDNGVYISQASSSHTFNGTVDLKEFRTAAGAAVNFNGSTTLDNATITQATVTFAGKTDIAEAAISGGTTNFNGTATLTTLTQTGGTINANGTVEVMGKVTGTGGTLALQSGELKLSYTGEDGNSISLLDGSKGGAATGTLRVAKDASVTVAGQIWGRKASSIVLEQGAELVNTADEVKFSNRGTAEATFRTASTVNDAEYSTNSTDWELINGHLASTASGDKMLTNKLVNSSVENAGSGKLTVSNSGNSITDVYATSGSIDIEQLNAAVNLNLSELTVADSKTVGLYSGSGDSRVEANVTVTSRAEFGSGAVLNANLTLQSGSTLGVAEGGLAMGSTLTLQKGLTLDDTTLGRVHALSAGESTALFTGVDGLTLDKTPYTSLTEADSILANPYFTNLNSSNQYVLTYSGTDNGTLSIMAASVPEPTTTTLSLLALSALAMRRRRK